MKQTFEPNDCVTLFAVIFPHLKNLKNPVSGDSYKCEM